ncbi:hypothetical protein [Peribacillus sp. NPDC096448]|uniref:hypothetical protein n=1 Tax=Peribacillus sp. NPDC096448 TaxID=3364395 RepID=UPI0038074FEF
MKDYVLIRLTRNKRWFDFVNFKNLECQAALLFAIVLLVVINLLHVHETFSSFLIAFQNITLGIAQALIGMLGFVLAGIAIITSTLKKDVVKKIEQVNGKGTIEQILSSFEFLAINISISIVLFYVVYLMLYSPSKLIGTGFFNCMVFLISYLFIFTIFYSAALVSNCAKLFLINNTYEEIVTNEKKLIEVANEVRIDFMLNALFQENQISKEEFLMRLD